MAWFHGKSVFPSIVILEEVVVVKIERVEHQVPVFAPNEVPVLQFVVEKPDGVMVLVVLWMGTFDEKWLEINDISLSVGKSDTKFVIP